MGIEAGVEPGSGSGGGENEKPDKINYGTVLAVTEFTVQAVQYHHTHDLNGKGPLYGSVRIEIDKSEKFAMRKIVAS